MSFPIGLIGGEYNCRCLTRRSRTSLAGKHCPTANLRLCKYRRLRPFASLSFDFLLRLWFCTEQFLQDRIELLLICSHRLPTFSTACERFSTGAALTPNHSSEHNLGRARLRDLAPPAVPVNKTRAWRATGCSRPKP